MLVTEGQAKSHQLLQAQPYFKITHITGCTETSLPKTRLNRISLIHWGHSGLCTRVNFSFNFNFSSLNIASDPSCQSYDLPDVDRKLAKSTSVPYGFPSYHTYPVRDIPPTSFAAIIPSPRSMTRFPPSINFHTSTQTKVPGYTN